MKILFLTHTFPYPLNDGVRLHVYHILKQLAPKHEIYLLCLNDVPVNQSERAAVHDLGVKSIEVINHPVPHGIISRFCNTFFDSIPFCVRQFESVLLKQTLLDFLSSTPIDVVHVDYISMAVYRDVFKSIPAVFFPHDAVSMLYDRNIGSETGLFRKIYTLLQYKKIKAFEGNVLPKFEWNMVVSPVDRNYLLKHCPNSNIAVSANGVDTDYFIPQPEQEEENSILFRGVMNFVPNADAARFFYRSIFPLIREEIPDAKFYVVGKSPPEDLQRDSKEDPHLIVTDYVPDLRTWMSKASVVVCPMRIGSGIKNKILEPMAMSKAIVASTLACAGLNVKNDECLFIEDDAPVFAKKVVSLLRNRDQRIKLGEKSREFVVKFHTWKKNSQDFEQLYEKAVAAKRKDRDG